MGFRYPYLFVGCSDVSSPPFGSFVWLGLRCLHCFSLWLFLYLCYLLCFPLRFLIWPLLAPFSFFLFFDMVLCCCCSVPAVWNCVTRCLSCSSLGPCILGFLRFVSLLSIPLFPGISPVSSSIPLGLLPVCSGSVSFLRHRLPVLSCLSFSPLLVDSPPPAFLGLLAFAYFVGFAFPVIPSLAPPCLSPLVFAFCMLQFGIILVVPLSALSSCCEYGCLFLLFLHVFPSAVVLTVPSCFSPLFSLLCLFLFFGGLPRFSASYASACFSLLPRLRLSSMLRVL